MLRELRAGRHGGTVLAKDRPWFQLLVRLTGVIVEAGRQHFQHMPQLAAAGIHLRRLRRQMECDPSGVVGSEEVAHALADPLPHLVGVGLRIVLEPDGEGVTCGLNYLIAAYAGGLLNDGGYSHGQKDRLSTPELRTRRISSVRPSTEIVLSGLPHRHGSIETTTLSPSW